MAETIYPISDNTTPVDENGVLTGLVRQPCDGSPSEDERGLHYKEQWKGPYSKMKEVLSLIKVGDTINFVYGMLNTNYSELNRFYEPPACPSRNGQSNKWIVESISVQEIKAGALAILTIEYSDIFDNEDEDELSEDPYQDVWTLTWQSYTVDAYAFCSNEPSQPYPCSPHFDVDPQQAIPPDSWDKPANRSNISKYMNSIHSSKDVNGKTYWYYTPDEQYQDTRYFLNDVEAEVLKKKMLDRGCVYHYPIITHQRVLRGKISLGYDTTVGSNIDHIVSLDEDCPYKFPLKDGQPEWTFVKIGDEMTQTKTKDPNTVTYVHRETFAGYKGVDRNFYGNTPFAHTEQGITDGRWEFEAL